MPGRDKRTQPRIDIHAHVIPPEILGKAGRHGPDIVFDEDDTMVIRVGDYRLRGVSVAGNEEAKVVGRKAQQERYVAGLGDPLRRVAELDDKDIDVLGVTIPPLFYFYDIEAETAIEFARAANDALARYCEAAPQRFFYMPSLPLQDVGASVEEIRRNAARGARGVNVGGRGLAGKELYSEELWPIYQELERQDLPLCIHPSPTELSGRPADRYTGLILDYPFECAQSVNNLVLGGVFDDFPRLKVYVSHGGGFIPYQFGRIETFATLNRQVRAKNPPRQYLKNFFFDTLVHDLAARRFLVDWMGPDNLVVGDNYGGMDSVDGFAFLDELSLDAGSADKIRGGNARELFKLDDHLV
ncbi:amidohydrolase family protein [Amycolatopsis ultiminotia]|uniref:Amidohydrolase family protein n=1 Tax=Amycolatopsis ultiminotia TaxID=543629 RepID=A0ABP6YD78_9PSEU